MTAIVINGKELAKDREEMLRKRVTEFTRSSRRRPKLLAVELSSDDGSRLYLRLKRAAAERIGIEFEILKRSDLVVKQGQTLIHTDGIFLQHPPRQKLRQLAEKSGGQAGLTREQIDDFWQQLTDQIPPEKDVDCLTRENLQLVRRRRPKFLPAAVKSVGYCLAFAAKLSPTLEFPRDQSLLGKFLQKKSVVVVGRSDLVGMPLFWWLSGMAANASQLHSQTPRGDFLRSVSTADVLVSATGRPGLITGDMVKPDAVVIDVGSPKGDVVFEEVVKKASAISPVPGGVGPLTVVSLMENVLQAAENYK